VVDGSAAPDGIIVYIKPVCYGNEPRDIYEYFKRNETFPHESTADQFFSESQFESYRMLGAHTMEKLCTKCGGDFQCFIREILERHLQMKSPDWLAGLLESSAKNAGGRVSQSRATTWKINDRRLALLTPYEFRRSNELNRLSRLAFKRRKPGQ